jgi:phytoene/squalene synthetase
MSETLSLLIGRGEAAGWSLEAAHRHCQELVRPAGAGLVAATARVPAPLRASVVAIQAFVKTAEGAARDGGQAALDDWEEQLRRCLFGEADHPVLVALLDTIERLALPLPPLADLLEAVRIDRQAPRFTTFAALRRYTALSAEPLGRLLLAALGRLDPELVRFADELSTALQLTTFWRNVGPDAARGRIYLPEEDLYFFTVSESDLRSRQATQPLRQLLRFQVARTRSLYELARPLLRRMGPGTSQIWHQGMAALDEIEAADFDLLDRPSGAGSGGPASFLESWLLPAPTPVPALAGPRRQRLAL